MASPTKGRHFWRSLAATFLLFFFWALPSHAKGETESAGSLPQVQAKYVMNFIAFTTWPDSAAVVRDRVVGVLGDEFGALALEELVDGGSGKGPPAVKVRRIRQTDDLEGCDVLVVGDGFDVAKWSAALVELRTKPVLTIGTGRIFAQRHGLVGLYPVEGRLRFAVNFKRVEATGLSLSSRLLSLAEIVEN